MTQLQFHKAGQLYQSHSTDWSHGSHPCIIHFKEDTHILAFTCRDKKQRSHIFLSLAEVKSGRVSLIGQLRLALSPGPPGYFDSDGVISGCLMRHQESYYLYFVGWQNLPEGLWICDTGRAVLDPENLTLRKEFLGPVLGRDRYHPLFAAATAFFITEDEVWHTWYNSGLSWKKKDGVWHHKYGLHHAVSRNGLDWVPLAGMAIPFADKYEYAFGRPSVVKWGGIFHMWFAHRATKDIPTYRIGYACSEDGMSWHRDDSLAGIEVSPSGWDSEMICYPCVFEHKGIRYMLYNGNGYGRTGFGLAVLEEE